MDDDPNLEQDLASWYQCLIGMISYMVEIGRVDIIIEVSIMVSQMPMPREEHLEAVLHVFAFLLQDYNPIYPAIRMNDFRHVPAQDGMFDLIL